MYCTWKNTKCRKSETIMSTLKNSPFVLSDFLSHKYLSISYESWDVHLTFYTLINAFRFKTKPLGGAKVKSACGAKLAEFRKMSAISSIFTNFLNFVLVKDLTNCLLFPLIVSFWKHTFLLGCNVWKKDALFQRPLGPISIILNYSKNFLVRAEIKQLYFFFHAVKGKWLEPTYILFKWP